jgi:hypothetical protein
VDWVDADVLQVRGKLTGGHHLGHSLVTWQSKFQGQNKKNTRHQKHARPQVNFSFECTFLHITVTIIILQKYKTFLLLNIFTKS